MDSGMERRCRANRSVIPIGTNVAPKRWSARNVGSRCRERRSWTPIGARDLPDSFFYVPDTTYSPCLVRLAGRRVLDCDGASVDDVARLAAVARAATSIQSQT